MLGLLDIYSTVQVQIIVALITVDAVLGILAAISQKEFKAKRIADFVKGPIAGYLLGYGIVSFVAEGISSLAFLLPVSFVCIMLSLLASLLHNLHKLGLPLPYADKV